MAAAPTDFAYSVFRVPEGLTENSRRAQAQPGPVTPTPW